MSIIPIIVAYQMSQRIREGQMTQTPSPKPVKPQSTKSKTVLIALILFAFALAGGVAAIFTPAVAPLAIIVALVAVGLCVLSLREDL